MHSYSNSRVSFEGFCIRGSSYWSSNSTDSTSCDEILKHFRRDLVLAFLSVINRSPNLPHSKPSECLLKKSHPKIRCWMSTFIASISYSLRPILTEIVSDPKVGMLLPLTDFSLKLGSILSPGCLGMQLTQLPLSRRVHDFCLLSKTFGLMSNP